MIKQSAPCYSIGKRLKSNFSIKIVITLETEDA